MRIIPIVILAGMFVLTATASVFAQDQQSSFACSKNVLDSVSGFLEAMNTSNQQDRKKAATAITETVKSNAIIKNCIVETRKISEIKSESDVYRRNIALLVGEIAFPQKNDVWRKIIRDEKVMKRITLEDNIRTFGAMISMGVMSFNAMNDYNTGMVVSSPNLTLDDFIKLYGNPDTFFKQPSETWYIYGPVGVATEKESKQLNGRLLMAGFLWYAFHKTTEGKYPTEPTKFGLPDIDYPFNANNYPFIANEWIWLMIGGVAVVLLGIFIFLGKAMFRRIKNPPRPV